MIKFICIFILTGFAYLPLQANEKIKSISTKTAVIFNTLCAKCHEGGCSGRLSFYGGHKSASSHIKRYAGDSKLSENETKDFFTLLNYMKTECALLMPNNGAWEQQNLSHFALPSKKGYFIPLGNLKNGKYNLTFTTEENISFRVEVISNHLNHYIDKSVCSHQKEYIFSFTVDESANSFLRILSHKPLHLMGLELKKY
ncbi:MAG: hypothetical protein KAQ94_02960 [Arcobacteraceae bacterium]|nr:hypothetical protein [Arcobacteraceae bacterium]